MLSSTISCSYATTFYGHVTKARPFTGDTQTKGCIVCFKLYGAKTIQDKIEYSATIGDEKNTGADQENCVRQYEINDPNASSPPPAFPVDCNLSQITPYFWHYVHASHRFQWPDHAYISTLKQDFEKEDYTISFGYHEWAHEPRYIELKFREAPEIDITTDAAEDLPHHFDFYFKKPDAEVKKVIV